MQQKLILVSFSQLSAHKTQETCIFIISNPPLSRDVTPNPFFIIGLEVRIIKTNNYPLFYHYNFRLGTILSISQFGDHTLEFAAYKPVGINPPMFGFF